MLLLYVYVHVSNYAPYVPIYALYGYMIVYSYIVSSQQACSRSPH